MDSLLGTTLVRVVLLTNLRIPPRYRVSPQRSRSLGQRQLMRPLARIGKESPAAHRVKPQRLLSSWIRIALAYFTNAAKADVPSQMEGFLFSLWTMRSTAIYRA